MHPSMYILIFPRFPGHLDKRNVQSEVIHEGEETGGREA